MRKVKLAGFFVVLTTLMGIMGIGRGQAPSVPPGDQYPQGEVKANGYYVINRGTRRTLGLSVAEMESLIYGRDEIPGFEVRPNPDNGNHTCIYADLGGNTLTNPMVSYIGRCWYRDQPHPDFYDVIRIDLEVRESKEEALRVLRMKTKGEYAHSPWDEGSISGVKIGDECYRHPDEEFLKANRTSYDELHSIHLNFVVGRVKVRVRLRVDMTREARRRRGEEISQGLRLDYTEPGEFAPADVRFLEALALGMEYRIRRHPKWRMLIGEASPPRLLVAGTALSDAGMAFLREVAVAPTAVLRACGAQIEERRTAKEWTNTLRRSGQWVRVKAFAWEMETSRGTVKLERPVFPCKGELIVSLRQVAEALGIKVQQRGERIALLTQ